MACLQTSGCTFQDQLAASRFQADTCRSTPRDRSLVLSVVGYVLFAVAAVFTLAMLISRSSAFPRGGYGWNDLVAAICFAALTVFFVAEYYAVMYGNGRDIWSLNLDDSMRFQMWLYIAGIFYVFVIFGTKISIVLLYLRVWPDATTFRKLCWITLGLLAAALVAFEVSTIAQCRPISSQWEQLEDLNLQGQCIDRQSLLWALAGVVIAFDVVVMLLPVRHLVKLKISSAKRVGACAVFLVGFAVTAMSIARIFYVRDFTTAFNKTYDYSFLSLFGSIEVYLSQVACCMPSIAGLAQRLWSSMTTDFSSLGSKKSSRTSMRISAPLQIPEIHDFADIKTPRDIPDLEKAEKRESADMDYVSDDESAPPPVVQRSSHNSHALKHNSSFEPIIERIEHQRATYRSSATTAVRHSNYRDSGTDARTPDILYHDHQNQLRLEIHDPPDQPIKAQLQYVDKNDAFHDLELQGRPKTSSTRPNTAPTQGSPLSSYSTTNYSSSSISTDPSMAAGAPIGPRLSLLQPNLLPWSQPLKGRPSMEDRSKSEEEKLADLANAHKILTEEGMSSNHTQSTI
ncbi:hypothetical protein Slin15195_G068300 [Septoria linicola]|uniref:Rhodopsin domain-containing protein n=1 Tax=Septoria linicola TaxID=215465 RepID=A0A9Q9AXA9_9PEZI|nr:hypothetical protein Slin15195_G068300 [Septoria linicola]